MKRLLYRMWKRNSSCHHYLFQFSVAHRQIALNEPGNPTNNSTQEKSNSRPGQPSRSFHRGHKQNSANPQQTTSSFVQIIPGLTSWWWMTNKSSRNGTRHNFFFPLSGDSLWTILFHTLTFPSLQNFFFTLSRSHYTIEWIWFKQRSLANSQVIVQNIFSWKYLSNLNKLHIRIGGVLESSSSLFFLSSYLGNNNTHLESKDARIFNK